MKVINRLLLLTVVLNFFIIVGAGHGFGFLGLVELISINQYLKGIVKYTLTGTYQDMLFVAASFAAIGQITLLISYFNKNLTQKFYLLYFGLFVLFISYVITTIDFNHFIISNFAILAGMPFLLSGILLLILTRKYKQQAQIKS